MTDLNVGIMDYIQNFLFIMFDETVTEDMLSVTESDENISDVMDWDQYKIDIYIVCCHTLSFHIQNDANILAKALRYFDDGEIAFAQGYLAQACEAYCQNPYSNEQFVLEVIKAAPEMLLKAEKSFGYHIFRKLLLREKVGGDYFHKAVQSLSPEKQQIIAAFATQKTASIEGHAIYSADLPCNYNARKSWICHLLEQSVDDNDTLPWYKREWYLNKIAGYRACCFALLSYIRNDSEVLSRILRCFCDADGDEVQYSLVHTCEAFCDSPYTNQDYINSVVNAAPEMLKVSPIWFGGHIFQAILNLYDDGDCKTFFMQSLRTLNKVGQQIIVDFITYLTEEYTPEKCPNSYDDKYDRVLADCLTESGLPSGSSQYFTNY